MQTPPSRSLPAQPAPVSDDADLAREVALRMERWYRERRLDLAPEVQAGFAEMGVEAVVRHPERPRDAVLDELIAELDASLTRIQGEAPPDTRFDDAGAAGGARGWLRRLLGHD